MKTYPIYASKNLKKNEEAYEDTGQLLCVCCGKPTSSANMKYIHATTSWLAINEKEAVDSQGYFPIGSDCAKKFPKEFIFE